jgi:hypothetical protein
MTLNIAVNYKSVIELPRVSWMAKRDDYVFYVTFDLFLMRSTFFTAAGTVVKIDLSLNPNHYSQILPS